MLDLDKEFKFIMSMKDFTRKNKKKLNKGEYIKLEYYLDEPLKKDFMEEELEEDQSVNLQFNPNFDNSAMLGKLNQANLFALPGKKEIVVNNDLANKYKSLLDHSLARYDDILTALGT